MNKHDQNDKLSRRDVLIGAGSTAGVAVAAALPGMAVASAEGQGWDMETDVVCVGSGAAACSAAVTAKALGAKVIMIEKMPMTGGTTNKSGGITWIANNKFIKAAGKQDGRDDCLRYMARYAYPQHYSVDTPMLGLRENDYRMLEAFYDNGSKMIDWMETIGAIRFREFKLFDLDIYPPDYGDHMPENKMSFMRSLEPADNMGPYTGGASLVAHMEEWLRRNDVPILLEHHAVDVIKHEDSALGLAVQGPNRSSRIRARRGIIFGTGGFAHNVELVSLHQPEVYGSCAAASSTGDFMAIAQRAGAKMGPLGTAWRSQVVLEQVLDNRVIPHGVYFPPGDSMIQVNKYGKRVVNEKRNYNDRTRAHFAFDPVNAEYPNQLLFMIFDERTLNRYGGSIPLPVDKRESEWLIEGRNAEQLAGNIRKRLDSLKGRIGAFKLAEDFAANLDVTLERFNQFAENGRDQDFDRGLYDYDRIWEKMYSRVSKHSRYPDNDKPNSTMYPIDRTSMLYAVILAPGALDTSGGPMMNQNGQILAADGKPIPGLYGAGNCVASVTGPAYMGAGGTIGPAMTFGYIAAHHAVGKKV